MNGRKSFVVAQIAELQRLFELESVHEVVPAMALTTSLSVCGHCRGIANVRGQVLPVFDIARRRGPLDPSQFIVIAADGSGALIGILVDDVIEIVELSASEVVAHPVGLGRVGRTVNLRGTTVGVLTAAEVVDAA
jgi:purine-binding chemotaxis protein CheW